MRSILILWMFFISETVVSQTPTYTGVDPCSGLLYVSSDISLEYTAGDVSEFYLQYAATNFPESVDFLIKDFSGEIELEFDNRKSNKVEFKGRIKGKTLFLSIDLKERIIKTNPEEITNDDYLFFENVVEDSLGYSFLGSFKRVAEVQITSIEKVTLKYRGKEYIYDDSSQLRRLINPQLFASEGSFIKPIRAYYFKESHAIGFYFNGQILNKRILDISGSDAHESYLSKLIFDICGKKDPILNVIPGAYLGVYGWLDCREKFDFFDFF